MGIGRRTAEILSVDGCAVAIVGLPDDPVSIESTVAAINAAGGKATGIGADMTRKTEVERAVAECKAVFGPPDIVIANVNGPPPGFFDEVTDEQFEEAVRSMTMTLVFLMRETLPHMKAKGWGRVVNMSAIGAKEPTRLPAHTLVNTGRAAAVALAKSLSDEYAAFGITVNSIGTGFIGTDRLLGYYDRLSAKTGTPRAELLKDVTASIPAGRVGRVDEIAASVAFLCSDLGGYVNGEFINVDGGWHRSAW
jgi:NAD(P)-dependent dehydrogenase (short-subunit alcohol dehydrogenase family)